MENTENNAINQEPVLNNVALDKKGNKKAVASLVLGIIGMLAWIIPIIGLPIQVVGLVFGIKSIHSNKRGLAIAGIVMTIIGLVLTIANGTLGAYLGATGQL